MSLTFTRKTRRKIPDRVIRNMAVEHKVKRFHELWAYVSPKVIIALEQGFDDFLPPINDIRENAPVLKTRFGDNGYRFIRTLFIRYQIGGKGYATRWKLNIACAFDFARAFDNISYADRQQFTIAKALKLLATLGYEPITRVKERDASGKVISEHFMTREEYESFTKRTSELRAIWRKSFQPTDQQQALQ